MPSHKARAEQPVATAEEQARHAERLRTLYAEHLTTVYRFIYSKVGNREEAEDLTSQVFLKALRDVDAGRTTASIQGWLFQVARTTIADHWRAFYHLRTRSLDDLLAAGVDIAVGEPTADISAQPAQRVERILERLPENYREVLTQRFLLNHSVRETAENMRLSEANVKVLQFRALKRAAHIESDLRNDRVTGEPGT